MRFYGFHLFFIVSSFSLPFFIFYFLYHKFYFLFLFLHPKIKTFAHLLLNVGNHLRVVLHQAIYFKSLDFELYKVPIQYLSIKMTKNGLFTFPSYMHQKYGNLTFRNEILILLLRYTWDKNIIYGNLFVFFILL